MMVRPMPVSTGVVRTPESSTFPALGRLSHRGSVPLGSVDTRDPGSDPDVTGLGEKGDASTLHAPIECAADRRGTDPAVSGAGATNWAGGHTPRTQGSRGSRAAYRRYRHVHRIRAADVEPGSP